MPNCFDKQAARHTYIYIHTPCSESFPEHIYTDLFFIYMCMQLVMYSHQSLSALHTSYTRTYTHIHIHTHTRYAIPSSILLRIIIIIIILFFVSFFFVYFYTTCYSLDEHPSIYIHKRGQICVVGGKPEATAINNIELSLFLCSLIDYLDWQATNICMGALGGNALGDRQWQRRVPKELVRPENDL